ncbi:MAG: response regulator transcription factor [Dehalococcoidales bacterium]|jgi:NarL family two-component system response regulator LiaR|nr:response regulator transcription factor [Dehalococcoidales bacterium]
MIRVIIADDHRLVVESLRKILDGERDIKCVGVANNGLEAIQLVEELHPDVAILDVDMPDMDGIEATRRIKADFPDVTVLVLTAYDYEEYVVACLEAGADGFVLKANLPCDGLVNAVRTVNMGRAVFDHDAICTLKKFALGKDRSAVATKTEICDREKEILRLAAKGMTSKEIASALNISGLTVNSHFSNIFRKLNVQSRIEAVMVALKRGWVSVSDSGSQVS